MSIMLTVQECSFPDCARPIIARKLCWAHYQQQRRGTPLRAIDTREQQAARRLARDRERARRQLERARLKAAGCQSAGCTRPVCTRGLCNMHYGRARDNGTLGTPCAVAGCTRGVHGRGWCKKHYMQLWLRQPAAKRPRARRPAHQQPRRPQREATVSATLARRQAKIQAELSQVREQQAAAGEEQHHRQKQQQSLVCQHCGAEAKTKSDGPICWSCYGRKRKRQKVGSGEIGDVDTFLRQAQLNILRKRGAKVSS